MDKPETKEEPPPINVKVINQKEEKEEEEFLDDPQYQEIKVSKEEIEEIETE